MSDYPEVAILFMTKESENREGIAVRSIEALKKNLRCEYPWYWFFALGTSSQEYKNSLQKALGSSEIGWIVESDGTPGAVWNNALEKIFERFQIYFRLEDDFVLKEPLDITPYVNLLWKRGDIGMIRLGLMPIDLKLFSVVVKDQDFGDRIFFDCLPETNYAYSGNPGLVHKRLHDAAGYFHTSKNPGEIEVDFDYRIRQAMLNGGPRIWWPLELGKYGTYGVWDHIGRVKSY